MNVFYIDDNGSVCCYLKLFVLNWRPFALTRVSVSHNRNFRLHHAKIVVSFTCNFVHCIGLYFDMCIEH